MGVEAFQNSTMSTNLQVIHRSNNLFFLLFIRGWRYGRTPGPVTGGAEIAGSKNLVLSPAAAAQQRRTMMRATTTTSSTSSSPSVAHNYPTFDAELRHPLALCWRVSLLVPTPPPSTLAPPPVEADLDNDDNGDQANSSDRGGGGDVHVGGTGEGTLVAVDGNYDDDGIDGSYKDDGKDDKDDDGDSRGRVVAKKRKHRRGLVVAAEEEEEEDTEEQLMNCGWSGGANGDKGKGKKTGDGAPAAAVAAVVVGEPAAVMRLGDPAWVRLVFADRKR